MDAFFAAAAVISHLVTAVPGAAECSEPYLHFQQYDSSCGFAAVSAVMDCWWDTETDEMSLIDAFFSAQADKTSEDRDSRAEGVYTITFSDMQSILEQHGFISAGFQLDLETVDTVRACLESYGPFIIHEEIENGHFSLLIDIYDAGTKQPTAVLADPNTGIEFYPWNRLRLNWDGSTLIAADSSAAGSGRVPDCQRVLRKELKTQYESFRFFTERYASSAFGL